ncbi:hypothetical protein [Duganella sp. LjRoot269]|jgi:hypothetical protein|uniref:hypothetical protein n=1 Tax=Duganella sp. LjRoot269 TaxID=3342305 RepID=UPI003ECD2709
MTGESYAVVLLAGASGLALSANPVAGRLKAYAGFVLAMSLAAMMPLPPALARQAGWYCIIALALSLHLPLLARLQLALSVAAGFCAGASMTSPYVAAIAVLLIFPAGLLIGNRAPVLVKILAGWLAAVALLTISLAYLPVSPGYMPDHLD